MYLYYSVISVSKMFSWCLCHNFSDTDLVVSSEEDGPKDVDRSLANAVAGAVVGLMRLIQAVFKAIFSVLSSLAR